jgi:hypothetical protein
MKQQEKLSLATKLIEKKDFFFAKTNFNRLYPFTTENIAAYIDRFIMKDKKLLTVGSSGDQVFNAALRGCKDITVLDRSPFAKEYYYLKKAAVMNLDVDDYLELLARRNYPNKGDVNDRAFNKEILNYVLDALKEEDYESYEFWIKLLNKYDEKLIREKLFLADEHDLETLIKSNIYLRSLDAYGKLQHTIKDINPKFLIQDIRNASLDEDYDVIFLSNIFDYIKRRDAMYTMESVLPHLKDNGNMLIYYLYSITLDDEIPDIDELYDPNAVLRYVPYSSKLYAFDSIENKNIKQKDGIIVYKKVK